MSGLLPDVSYGEHGATPKPGIDETPDDDEELAETPADVVEILGFDPAKEPV